jgi:hypothetical protein
MKYKEELYLLSEVDRFMTYQTFPVGLMRTDPNENEK